MSSTFTMVADLLAKDKFIKQLGGILCLTAALSVAGLAQTNVPRPPNASTPSASNTVQHPPEAAPAEDPNSTFRVNVKLVNVFSTVTNPGGAPVSTLKQEDFQVFEDGKP